MFTGYGYINTNQDLKLETYKDYLNSELIKNKSMSLVHYSLANRGSALYYQKMFIIRLFRQSFLKNKSILEDFKLKNGYVEGIRHIGFGTSFQQKYCYLTILHQVRRKITDIVYNNDSNKIGTFKNFINNNNYKTGNSLYRADVEGRRSYNFKRIV